MDKSPPTQIISGKNKAILTENKLMESETRYRRLFEQQKLGY